jgi:hypothetical protein
MTPPEQPTFSFYRMYPGAISPLRADKAALGTMPTMAFRHCEPMRTASAFGWYVFPPEDILLKWNGVDVFVWVEQDWLPFDEMHLPGLAELWDSKAPAALTGLAPPYLRLLPMKGMVQIWSGLLCSAKPGWSALIRPPVNLPGSHLYSCYEGLIEVDQFKPVQLFVNIQLISTDVPIRIPKHTPLFQVQPMLRATYGEEAHQANEVNGLGSASDAVSDMTEEDWIGYRNTIRVQVRDEAPEAGRYAASTRKRTKHEDA